MKTENLKNMTSKQIQRWIETLNGYLLVENKDEARNTRLTIKNAEKFLRETIIRERFK